MSAPLHDLQTERAVLGCVLQGATVLDTGPLPEDAFAGPNGHPAVWRAMLALAASGKGVDHLTLAEVLSNRKELTTVGTEKCRGPAYLMSLDEQVPLQHNLRDYCARLRDLAARRAMVAEAERARERAMDMRVPPARAALESAQAFASVRMERPLVRGGRAVLRLAQRWEDFINGTHQPYLAHPYEALTEAGFRGFVSNLNIVAGRSGNFKTGFVTGCIDSWVANNIPGGVFGLEDGVEWVTDRPTARHMGIPYGDVGACRLKGNTPEMQRYHEEKLAEWMGHMHEAYERNLFLYDTTDTGLDTDAPSIAFPDLLAEARRMIQAGAKWLVIDHGLRVYYPLQGRDDRRDLAIGRALDTLANLGMRTGVPIIVLWHFNRDSDEGTAPKRSDLKEGATVDAAARTILGLWRQPSRSGVQLATAVKATKGKEGVTAALEVDGEAGLLRTSGGYVVDLAAEATAAREQRTFAKRSGRSRLFDPEAAP